MPQEFCSAILKTTDVAGTIEWYRRVGFEVRSIFPDTGEPTWCEVSRDGVVAVPWRGDAMARAAELHGDSLLLSRERGGRLRPDQGSHDSRMGTGGPRVGRSGAWTTRPQRVLPHLHGARRFRLTGRAYGSPSRSIPTSTARSVESSSQSIRGSADEFGRRPAYRSRREQRARDDF